MARYILRKVDIGKLKTVKIRLTDESGEATELQAVKVRIPNYTSLLRRHFGAFGIVLETDI